MNLIDLFALLVLAASVIYGLYRGFLNSVMSLGCVVLSVLLALAFGPLLGKALVSNEGLLNTVSTYTVSVVIPSSDKTAGEEDYITSLVDSLSLPEGLKGALREELTEEREKNGLYGNEGNGVIRSEAGRVMAKTVIAALSYVLVFMLFCIAFSVVISLIRHVADMKILKRFDWIISLGAALLRGMIILTVVFLLLPVIASMSPVGGVNEMIDGSFMAKIFGSDGFFITAVKGVLV